MSLTKKVVFFFPSLFCSSLMHFRSNNFLLSSIFPYLFSQPQLSRFLRSIRLFRTSFLSQSGLAAFQRFVIAAAMESQLRSLGSDPRLPARQSLPWMGTQLEWILLRFAAVQTIQMARLSARCTTTASHTITAVTISPFAWLSSWRIESLTRSHTSFTQWKGCYPRLGMCTPLACTRETVKILRPQGLKIPSAVLSTSSLTAGTQS